MSARIRLYSPPPVGMLYDLDRKLVGIGDIQFRPIQYVMCVDGMAVLDDPPAQRGLRLTHANSNIDPLCGIVDCVSEGRIV